MTFSIVRPQGYSENFMFSKKSSGQVLLRNKNVDIQQSNCISRLSQKKLNSIRSYVKELQTTKCRFFIKKLFFYSKSSKNVRFRHRIALKPWKTGSTHDFTFRKQYGDKTKSSKKIMIFSLFRCTSGYIENFMF